MLLALPAAVIRSRATHPLGRDRVNPRRHRHRITTINDELRAADLLLSFIYDVYHPLWICLVVFSNIPQSKSMQVLLGLYANGTVINEINFIYLRQQMGYKPSMTK
jgi:hypothetical protein